MEPRRVYTATRDERFEQLMQECRKQVLDNLIKPFGLAGVVFQDKDGGTVTTVHNFDKGVVATSGDQARYDEYSRSRVSFDRTPYDRVEVRNDRGDLVYNQDGQPTTQQFNSVKKKEMFQTMDSVSDGYTGKVLGQKRNGVVEKYGEIDLEHITSAHEIEITGKNHLFSRGETSEERQKDRVNLARDDRNLTLIDGSMNSSKSDRDLLLWARAPNAKDPSKTNADVYGVDQELMLREYGKSKSFLDQEFQRRQLQKQGLELASTTVSQGFRMGFQQALGLFLHELVDALWDEVRDSWKYGFREDDKGIMKSLMLKIDRIIRRVVAKWEAALTAFGDGFTAGALSNLVTFLINNFFTTMKKIVHVIREGFLSLVKAFKLIFFPPEDMHPDDVMPAAIKLISAGLLTGLGLLAAEALKAFLATAMPGAGMFINPFVDVIVGITTGIATALITFILDEWFVSMRLDYETLVALEQNLQLRERVSSDTVQLIESQLSLIEGYVDMTAEYLKFEGHLKTWKEANDEDLHYETEMKNMLSDVEKLF